ncbi:MAG: hypothetical protein AB7O43_02415 [Hyphomicrobiaceae bacterium]
MRGFTYLDDESWIESQMRRTTRDGLPISMRQAEQVTTWLKSNYGHRLATITKDTPFPPYVICGITCQETAYFWLSFVSRLKPAELLARCVLDASGDYPSTSRSAFPRNTAAFRKEYDDGFTDMLIGEANKTRALRDYSPQHWVYKGYGMFQYDLQYVVDDEPFFRDRQWYDIDECLKRVMKELNSKYARTGELWEAVRAYNGSGSRAQQYKRNVMKFCEVTKDAWEAAAWPPEPVPEVVPAPPAAEPQPAPVETASPEPAPPAVPQPPPTPVASAESVEPQAAVPPAATDMADPAKPAPEPPAVS